MTLYALPKTEPVEDALQSTVPQLTDDDDDDDDDDHSIRLKIIGFRKCKCQMIIIIHNSLSDDEIA